MGREWVRESTPVWDADKARIVGGAPEGIFQLPAYEEGERLPGDWWRVDGILRRRARATTPSS